MVSADSMIGVPSVRNGTIASQLAVNRTERVRVLRAPGAVLFMTSSLAARWNGSLARQLINGTLPKEPGLNPYLRGRSVRSAGSPASHRRSRASGRRYADHR